MTHPVLPPTGPRVAVVQHTAVCPPGRVGDWLTAAGCRLEVFHCSAGDGLPASLAAYDGLVVLGGEMGASDDAAHPWLPGTRALLRAAVDDGTPTLAVCLGLQLLAVACGGRVEPATTGPQTGVRAVEPEAAAADDPLLGPVPVGAPAVHWNNDLVVEPPPGAVVLSRSAGTVQALRLGAAAWGVQFHPEVDVATLRLWADADVAAGLLDADRAARRLADVATADPVLVRTWRALTDRFAEQLRVAGARRAGPPQRPAGVGLGIGGGTP
ncbi:GMP synthase-Glutamine amidotransferase [Friedmanniella luteola]|uniref:GMP synthase-Glutamine amidotransferase n=1 Tax=Friedmanniella luteola TaxID=546871 RepID=A0A1H1UKK4_9ACTN|nr:type 1 glutamine amidotransferase [Friedmanniella luteola]SDS72840.1 GMP synthase-Glutamine amidotransferase [Friedmanniella luteola]